MIKILLLMCLGGVIGYKFYLNKMIKLNGYFQYFVISLLIFCMGVSLGSRPTLADDIKIAGIQSLAFSLLPIIGSTVLVYIFFGRKENKTIKQKTDKGITE